jgi:RNA-directed DNA polymerase
MAQQKSENRTVPQGRRKAAPTRRDEPPGGGRAVPVNQRVEQLQLPFDPAEFPSPKDDGVAKGRDLRQRISRPPAVPRPNGKEHRARLATLDMVADYLEFAFEKVAANKGAPGPDRQTISEVRAHRGGILRELRRALLEGTYRPGDVRRVWIPKSGGGDRGLGIPNVVDRVVQEAVRQVLEPLYEPTFHDQSHGFRTERGCHTAIRQACEHLNAGYEWVVDLDLEKFFDLVHRQRLLARLSQRVSDKRVLVLIGLMLKAGVIMPDGVRVSTEEGLPQGGPLSPLLANIVLDELDEELCRRGHRFVRYADDCNIYVRSERAGQRVMASVTQFIDKRLRLKVNANKSCVARPATRHFLGFRLCPDTQQGVVDIDLSERSIKRLRERVRELTPRGWGNTMARCIDKVNAYLRGWLGHFGICTPVVRIRFENTDAHLRRRLRAILLNHWKRKRTMARRLIRLGAKATYAWRSIYDGRQQIWALSNLRVMNRTLGKSYWAHRGLVSLKERWAEQSNHSDASRQLTLPWR